MLCPCFAAPPQASSLDPETAKYVAALADKDPATRAEAARVLGTIGDPDAIPALSKTTYDTNAAVRWAAASALAEFATDEGIPPFEYPTSCRRQQTVFPLRRKGNACIFAIFSDGTGLSKLSDGPGDYEPMLSANGRILVYAGSNLRAINVRNMKSGKTRTLAEVETGSSVTNPQIADNGKVVVYLRDHCKVFATRPKSTAHVFLSEGFPSAGFYGVAISGNGRKVAFDTVCLREHKKRQSSQPMDELFVVDSDGSNLTCITASGRDVRDICPTLSRDGKRIAFMSGNYPDWDIWVANSDGTGKRNVSRHKACDGSPAISPDGTKVAFDSNRNGDWEIYTVDFDGEGLVQLTDSQIQCVNPRFSADGTMIFFETCQGYDRKDLCVMDADGRGMRILVRDMFGLKWRERNVEFVIRPKKAKFRHEEDVTIRFCVKNVGDDVLSLGEKIEARLFLPNRVEVNPKGGRGAFPLVPEQGTSFSLGTGQELDFSVTYAWQSLFPLAAKHDLSKAKTRLGAMISCCDQEDAPGPLSNVNSISAHPITVRSRR